MVVFGYDMLAAAGFAACIGYGVLFFVYMMKLTG